MENRNKAFVFFVVAFLVFRNIISFVFSLIGKVPYVFDMMQDILIPAVVACAIGYVLILNRKN